MSCLLSHQARYLHLWIYRLCAKPLCVSVWRHEFCACSIHEEILFKLVVPLRARKLVTRNLSCYPQSAPNFWDERDAPAAAHRETETKAEKNVLLTNLMTPLRGKTRSTDSRKQCRKLQINFYLIGQQIYRHWRAAEFNTAIIFDLIIS